MQTCGMEPNAALMLIPILIGVMVWLVVMIIAVVALCKIFSKAGYCWALGLLMFVPIANLVMFLVLAFSDWPILKELRALKQSHGSGG
jgi:hypothetical protein